MCPEARGEAVHAVANELRVGACDLLKANPCFGEDIREQYPRPAPVGDEAATYRVGDARERYVSLAGGHAQEVLVGKLYRVVHSSLDRELPGVGVYARRDELCVYEV